MKEKPCDTPSPGRNNRARSLPKTNFLPPTLIEVARYAKDLDSDIDPRAFVDYYQAKGWRMGSTKMKDWKAAFRTWTYRAENKRTGKAVDWRTEVDEQEKYNAYLCSPEWGQLKRIVGERSKGVCERCRSNPAFAVHHLTYIRKYAEVPEDLLHVCSGCHDYIHGKSVVDPRIERIKNASELPLGEFLNATDVWRSFQCSELVCPICSFEYVHFGAPEYRNSNDSYGAWHGRGDAIVIPCWCESGHKWEIVFGFHKGRTYAFCQSFGMQEGYEDA